MRTRYLIGGAAIAVGLSVFGIAGPASAHDLNGGSAQKTCVAGDGVDVTWSFTSSNATGHHIVSVTFNRAVLSSSFTASTVTAKTNEVAGTSPSLKATAVFEDDFVTSHTVTPTIPTDQCPPPPTTVVPPTSAPPTTPPPETAPPTTAPPTTAPPVTDTTVPETPTVPTTAPATVVQTTVPGSDTSVARATPTTICRSDVSAASPLQEGETVCSLPTTGGATEGPLTAVFIILPLAGLLILAARRRPEVVG